MKKMMIVILAAIFISACGKDEPVVSKDCQQAKNRVQVYNTGLQDLKELYKDEPNSEEGRRRIKAMENRVTNALSSQDLFCH